MLFFRIALFPVHFIIIVILTFQFFFSGCQLATKIDMPFFRNLAASFVYNKFTLVKYFYSFATFASI